MSETLNTPWIADYLINIAETYGCNLTNVPVHIKPGRRVQLLQFLTFQKHTEDDCVWSYVSDKHQQLPVRFSRQALAAYSKIHQPDSQGKRFTQQRSAIAIIKSFRPVFGRVPTGTVGKLSIQETLALQVDNVQVVGAAGEPEFGSPRALETHNDIKEWMEGLRDGGGGGNILKLRKERKLAEEQGGKSLTETSVSHEKSGDGRPTKAIGSVQSNGDLLAAEQHDWRQSIAKKPLAFYKRPPTSGTSALKSAVTGTNQGRDTSGSPMKPRSRHGKGALDLDSSPVITRDIENGSPVNLQRQTTPSEWYPSPSPRPEKFHTPSSSPQPAGERPISPPSTPPLFTPEQPQEAPGQETQLTELTDPSQAISTSVGEHDGEVSSLRPPTPGQRRRSVPLYSSSLSTTNSRTKATSLPSNVFESSTSNVRRVPPPSVKLKKEAYGEILVPSSDSGELVTQSSSHEYPSSLGPPRAKLVPQHAMASPRLGSSPERVNDSYDAPSSIPEPERSQDLNGPLLDKLSRMALHGSYPEQPHGDDVRTSNGAAAHKQEAAESPSSVPAPSYPSLPPSSIPIDSQSPTWRHSTMAVEETVAVEGTPYRATRDVTTKRTRPSPCPPENSPLQSKRPKLMSHEIVTPNRQRHGTTPDGLFDVELLKVGIEVNLADFDDNPPVFPWGEGMASLNLGQPAHPLRITNSKLAGIWENVCRSRGWCD